MNKLFTRSLTEQLPIEIIYIASTNKPTKRKIIIKKMNLDTVVAYCFLRKQFRTFRIECILAAYPLINLQSRSHSQ